MEGVGQDRPIRTPIFDPDLRHSICSLFKDAKCSNPRDKVYGLRQLLLHPEALSVDYSKDTMDVFMDLLRLGLLTRDEPNGFESGRALLQAMRQDTLGSDTAVSGRAEDYGYAPVNLCV